VDNNVDFFALSFVKDAAVIHELKDYLRRNNALRIQVRQTL
jgi:pyruvate kinase